MTSAGAARRCPVCDSDASARRFLARDAHYGIAGEWWIRQCARCDSFFLENPPSQDELAGMYTASYYAYAIPPSSPVKKLLQRLLFYSKATREPHFEQTGKVLDFGCGSGEFLLAMRDKGWQCAGVEINATARQRAREHGLDVRPAVGGEHGFDPVSFDYIRANHSLEHVLDPAAELRAMFAALRPGGTLFIGVPTNSSESARVFGASWWHLTAPLHTFVPSTRGMRELIERTGFRVVRMTTNGDYGGTAGSLQIALNRATSRRSSQGIVFSLRPLLLVGHWFAKFQDLRGVGDKLELVATKPA